MPPKSNDRKGASEPKPKPKSKTKEPAQQADADAYTLHGLEKMHLKWKTLGKEVQDGYIAFAKDYAGNNPDEKPWTIVKRWKELSNTDKREWIDGSRIEKSAGKTKGAKGSSHREPADSVPVSRRRSETSRTNAPLAPANTLFDPNRQDPYDPKAEFIWNRYEWREWCKLPPRERYLYMRWAMDIEKSEGNRFSPYELISSWKGMSNDEYVQWVNNNPVVQTWGDYRDEDIGDENEYAFETDMDENEEETRQRHARQDAERNQDRGPGVQDQRGRNAQQDGQSPIVVEPWPEGFENDWSPSPSAKREVIEAGGSEISKSSLNRGGLLKWQFVRTLYYRRPSGEGPNYITSSNCLYIGFDQQGLARDRVVVKSQFHGALNRQHAIMQRQKLIDTFPNVRNLAKNRGYFGTISKWPPVAYGITSYMDYYPGGDLTAVVDAYNDLHARTYPYDQIPEPFIWLVFNSMAEAIYSLHTGLGFVDYRIENVKAVGWKPVYHHDMKPENIFLGAPEEDHSAYPFPVLGDFDISIVLDDRSQWTRGPGTEGWYAPEHFHQVAGYPPKPPVSSKTDIYVLGMIIWDMINSSLGYKSADAERMNLRDVLRIASEGKPFPCLPDENQTMYSLPLIELMFWCLEINPEKRPSPLQLAVKTRKRLKQIERMMDPHMGGSASQGLTLRWTADQFPLGRKYEVKKRKAEENESDRESGSSGGGDGGGFMGGGVPEGGHSERGSKRAKANIGSR